MATYKVLKHAFAVDSTHDPTWDLVGANRNADPSFERTTHGSENALGWLCSVEASFARACVYIATIRHRHPPVAFTLVSPVGVARKG